MRGLGALLLPVLLAACGERAPRPNLLLISIDTLRADRLGCYGYARDTSPELDRFAREHAVRFDRVIAESPWTLPSHVTMLSGLHPLHHGVALPEHAPSAEVELLAETLHDAGYATLAYTGGGWLSATWGFDRGFDAFHAGEIDCADNVERLVDALGKRDDGKPWFAFLHTYEVHCPYDPPEPFASMFASADAIPIEVAGRCGNPDFNARPLAPGEVCYLSDHYDGSIRSVDRALGELFAFLEQSGALANTVVVITSDHGDEFAEHGRIGHERSLQREVLEVPLLVAAPGIAPRTIEEPACLADVAPTVLDLLGLPVRACDGRSRAPELRGNVPPAHEEPCLSVLQWQEYLLSSMDLHRHLIVDRARDAARIYDLDADPQERGTVNLPESETAVLRSDLERRTEALARMAIVPRHVNGVSQVERVSPR